MKRLLGYLLVGALSLTSAPATAAVDLEFHWQDKFSRDEKSRLVHWIKQTDAALTAIVGPLPFTRHVYFHRRENSAGPVPWAHTQRGQRQGVHLHVDPSFTQKAFLTDWTAPHELSHLIIPYLGEGYAWFAEGFASFMQYQVMSAMGVLTAEEVNARYTKRFQLAERNFNMHSLPFGTAAPILRARGQYPTMYWGGAIYFWQINNWLKTHTATNLMQILHAYVGCCRNDKTRLDDLINALDQLAGKLVFSHCLATFHQQPGFPEFRQELVITRSR